MSQFSPAAVIVHPSGTNNVGYEKEFPLWITGTTGPTFITGTVNVDIKNTTVNVSGSIDVANVISASIVNFPAVQAITGSVGVTNFPSVQTITGTVAVVQPVTVTGTVTSVITGTIQTSLTGTSVITGSVAITEAVRLVSGSVTRPFSVEPTGGRVTILSASTVTTSGTALVTWQGWSEWYLIVNASGSVAGTNPQLQFKIEEVDPIDKVTVVGDTVYGRVLSGTSVDVLQIVDTLTDTLRISWTVTGSNPVFSGVNASWVGHAAGNAIEGQTEVGTVADDPPVPVAGVDAFGRIQYLNVDDQGRLRVSPTSAGTRNAIRNDGGFAAATASYLEYTVPSNKNFLAQYFYVGGESGILRATLAGHSSGSTSMILNGDMENSASVQAWTAVGGTFTPPSPDLSTVQAYTGTGSFRWVYASSATLLHRRQTFNPTLDLTGYRYLRVRFFNDSTIGVTRTISVTISSGTPTRTWSLAALLPNSLIQSGAWTTLTCDLENPGSSTGTGFDLTAVDTISLKMQDSANRAGTIYWDTVRQEDQLDIRHRIYSSNGSTIDLVLDPSEIFTSGSSVYLILKNLGSTKTNATAIAGGFLEDAT